MGNLGELLSEIRLLEEALHRHEIRRSRTAVEELLSEDFVEFGSSGAIYRRNEIIDLLVQENDNADPGELLAYDYSLTTISSDAVLLTYRTRRAREDGSERHVLRSSIWKHSEIGWQMLFHQGTVIA
ncbi:DUF4440 domain-containing protein [Rhizobium mongolense]|uniref:DUF4440 domain-containing protein n=2 Tax=Rhizobium mongolense TaxID=57676 RepID=A0ABR6IWB9_9HYPH|nr:DUF4440 domain-containing protein [Rhizobium mongolense]MBB4231739.1 hypothetical protein [Rhizobium mongolense]TVZ64303.1 hypothetical protein BCL32_4538 [Rhizobium mongolense USDA 1844]